LPLSTSVKRAISVPFRCATKPSIACRCASIPSPLAPYRAVETRS
jgi:hypothetical protein